MGEQQVNTVGDFNRAISLTGARDGHGVSPKVRPEVVDDDRLAPQVQGEVVQRMLGVKGVHHIRFAHQPDDLTPNPATLARAPHDVGRIAEVVDAPTSGSRLPVRHMAVEGTLESYP